MVQSTLVIQIDLGCERRINLNRRPTVSRHSDRADHCPLVAASALMAF
jgi:hypothetical protein